MTLKDELPRLVGAQYATGDQWRNNCRKKEGTEPRQKQQPDVDVTGDGSKVQGWRAPSLIRARNNHSLRAANKSNSNKQ